MSQRLTISPHVRWRKVVEEAVIVNQAEAELVVLNASGCRLWELLAEGNSPAAIAEGISREFAVEPAQALEDVNQCLASLQELGIIVPDDRD
ncbi:PqqD family protein [Thiolapillus sp.]